MEMKFYQPQDACEMFMMKPRQNNQRRKERTTRRVNIQTSLSGSILMEKEIIVWNFLSVKKFH
jgi:hypothetical protein